MRIEENMGSISQGKLVITSLSLKYKISTLMSCNKNLIN